MAENNIGKITQVIGAVIDIKFTDGNLPEINSAINIKTNDGGKLVVEVAQHLGDDVVRCIAMGPTDGLVRGMDAEATGAPISVPVGEQTLGRMFNVLGDPIDNKPAPEVQEHMPIHRKAPAFAEQATNTEILETGIKVVDLLCPYQKGGKIGLFGGAVADRDGFRRIDRHLRGDVLIIGKAVVQQGCGGGKTLFAGIRPQHHGNQPQAVSLGTGGDADARPAGGAGLQPRDAIVGLEQLVGVD